MSRAIVPSTAGTPVLDLLAALEQIVGRDAVVAARAAMPPDIGAELAALTNVSWFPVASLGVVVDEIARQAGREPEGMLDQAVRLATERTFTTLWRVMLRLTSPEAIVARTPVFYAKSRNVGKLEARRVSDGCSEVTLSGWPDVSTRHVRTLAISIETVIHLAGRKKARATWTRTPDGARYRVIWEE